MDEIARANQDGVYRQRAIITEWPAKGLERLWKQPIGGGYVSFVFGERRAYTIEQRRERDRPRVTPTYHEGTVYSAGATGEFRALNSATGVVRWSKNILTDNDASNIQWGMSE